MQNHIYETKLLIKLSYAFINKIVQTIRQGEKYERNIYHLSEFCRYHISHKNMTMRAGAFDSH